MQDWKGLERDKQVVLAGLTLKHSNGQVEGQVNKLKLSKRMGYGRASFPFCVNVSFTLWNIFAQFSVGEEDKPTLIYSGVEELRLMRVRLIQ